MAQIQGSGAGNYSNTALVDDSQRLWVYLPGSVQTFGSVQISGNIVIGSVSASVDDIYVQSGTMFISSGANLVGSFYTLEAIPTASIYTNPAYKFEYVTSGTSTGVTGSQIGSITQFVGAGSYVIRFTWSNDKITNIGSYS